MKRLISVIAILVLIFLLTSEQSGDDNQGTVLLCSANSGGTNENQWRLIFDINEIEIDPYRTTYQSVN